MNFLEQFLILYARRFPIERGKVRIIDLTWRLAVRNDFIRLGRLKFGGFKMSCDLRDFLQRQYFFFGTYFFERHLLDKWRSMAQRAEMVFDIGANAGIYSLEALAANPRAIVHAFEPTPEIADGLRKTAALNGLDQLNVNEIAICNKVGTVNLIRCRGDGHSNDGMNYIQAHEGPTGDNVKSETLDHFCASNAIDHIDLMKIDIQGAEADALRGAERLLSEGRVGKLFIELNWTNEPSHCPATQSIELLSAHGYCFADPARIQEWRPAGTWLRKLNDVIAERPRGTVVHVSQMTSGEPEC
jgi:FkbM family methyltransferase